MLYIFAGKWWEMEFVETIWRGRGNQLKNRNLINLKYFQMKCLW